MAERVAVELIDDIDGSAAQQTLTFALDGVHYEIDLNRAHAQQLRSLLAGYIQYARSPEQPARARSQPTREHRARRQAHRRLTEQIRTAAHRAQAQNTSSQQTDKEPAEAHPKRDSTKPAAESLPQPATQNTRSSQAPASPVPVPQFSSAHH